MLVMGLVAAYRLVTVKPRPAKDYVKSPRPLNMAHQGGAGLALSNTIVAFRNALKVGADGLELDVHATKDGEVVVTHDDTVDRTTDGTGAVKDFTLAELKKLDAGYRFTPDNGQTYPYRGQGITIPTLREVLAEFPDQRINIEIKQSEPPIESKVLEVIDEMGMRDMVLVVSFDDAVMKWFREMAGDIAAGATENEIRTFVIYLTLKALPFYAPYANAGLKDLLHIPPLSDPRIKQVIEVNGLRLPQRARPEQDSHLAVSRRTISEGGDVGGSCRPPTPRRTFAGLSGGAISPGRGGRGDDRRALHPGL